MINDYSKINHQSCSAITLDNNNYKKEEDFLIDNFPNNDFLEEIDFNRIMDPQERKENEEKLIINKHLANLNV